MKVVLRKKGKESYSNCNRAMRKQSLKRAKWKKQGIKSQDPAPENPKARPCYAYALYISCVLSVVFVYHPDDGC